MKKPRNARYWQGRDKANGPEIAEKLREKPSRIKLLPFDTIALNTCRPYLVKRLIPRNGLTVIWGPPKSGKSFWTFDLAMHVALGWDYRGKRVQQGPVVYCAFEGQSGIKPRVEAFRQHHLAENAEAVPFYLQPYVLDLVKDCDELVAAIGATLSETKPAAVVLDTLNRSLRGSENSDEDMSDYIRAADTIREAFDCAVIIVHHCGVKEHRPRGHTSLTGAVDAQLEVKRDAEGNIIVTVEWMKDGEGEGDTLASRLEQVEVGNDEDGELITSCVVLLSEARAGVNQRRATGAAKLALDQLVRAVADAGEQPPASNHIPSGTFRVVPLSLWRRYCYHSTVTDRDNPETQRKAFNRASQKLQELGLIGIWENHVWPT